MVDETFQSQLNEDRARPLSRAPDQFQSQMRPAPARPSYNETANIMELAGAIADNDFITATLWRDMGLLMDMEYDEAWDPNNEDVLRQLFEENNLPIRTGWARRVRRSESRAHAEAILARINQELENEQTISDFFGDNNTGAFLSRLGLSLFDPAGWVAGGVAGKAAGAGLKGASRANLLAGMAARVGGATDSQVANIALQSTVGRGAFSFRSALASAAADGSLEAYHVSRSPTAGLDEAGIAALGSLALGGIYGALGVKGAQQHAFRRAVLELDDEIHRRFASEIVEEVAEEARPTPNAPYDPYGGSSVGAERVRQDDGSEVEVEDEFVDEFGTEKGSNFGNRVRIDAFAIFNRSDNKFTRALGNIMFEDGAASDAAKGRVQRFSVELLAHQHERVHTNSFARELLGAYDSYKKSNNISTFDSAMDDAARVDFMHKVARAVRGDETVEVTPEIAKARDAFRKSMRDQLKKAQEAGVLIDVDVNDLYVPRFWRRDAFLKVMEELGEETGTDVLANVIGKSLSLKGTDIELADEIARHLIKVVTSAGSGGDLLGKLSNMTPARAKEQIKKLLGDEISDEAAERVARVFSSQGTKAPDGPRAESRLDLDENAEISLNGRKFRLDDLLNNDLAAINTMYSRQIGGRIAFSEATGGKIKNTADLEKIISKAEAELDKVPSNKLEHERNKIKRMKAYADYLLGHGSLVDDAPFNEDTQAFLKFMRDVSFARLMGQVGYAQLSEIGTSVGALGLKAFIMQAPRAFKHVMTNYQPGVSEVHDNLIGVLSDMTALGNIHIQTRLRTFSPELDSEDVYGARDTAPGNRNGNPATTTLTGKARKILSKLGRSAELAARGTSILGGLQPITDFTQSAVGTGLIAQFARNARNGDALNKHVWGFKESKKRLLAMGIDDDMAKRIADMLNEVAEVDNKNLIALRIENATDQGAVDAMFRAITRESRRLVQEGDLGSSNMTMVQPLWRTILQFKTFIINAHVKQMLYGANMRDAQLMSEFLMSFIFATTGQMAKYNLMTLGMGPENRSDYLEYAFGEEGEERVAKAAASGLRYSSQVGLLPDAIDTLTNAVIGERFFDYRNTGLTSGFLDIEGAASFSTAKMFLDPVNELAQGEPDDAVRDAFRILPNYTPVRVLGNVLQEATPESFERTQPRPVEEEALSN